MKLRLKIFLVILAVLAVFIIVLYSCTGTNDDDNNDDQGVYGEPLPGLAGAWQDPETFDIFVIAWRSGAYQVVSVTNGNTAYPITGQSWDGSSLSWTYYIPGDDDHLSYRTTSLNGNRLHTDWWYSDEGSGTETLKRVP